MKNKDIFDRQDDEEISFFRKEEMASSQFPYEIKEVTKEEDQNLKSYYKGIDKPFIRIGPFAEYLMSGYREHAAKIYNVEVRPDDIWVNTFPRSGTTWTQELVWLIINNLDFKIARSVKLEKRYTFLEHSIHNSKNEAKIPEITHDFRNISEQTSPRYIKTHIPLSLLPRTLLDTAKVVYVARDPRDVVVSFYFAHKLFKNFDESVQFKEFWDLFTKDLVKYTPIFAHIKEAWDKRDNRNMIFLFYEEMQNDLRGVIDHVCKFLGKEYTDEQKGQLAEYIKFGNMKHKQFFDRHDDEELTFFRKGKAGNWVQYFDEEMKKEAEDFMRKNLKKTNMRFPNVTL